MKRLLLFFLVFSCLQASAQIKDFTIKIAANRPVIADVSKKSELTTPIPVSSGYTTYTNSFSLNEIFDEKSGVGLNSSFQVFTFKNFFIETGLGIQYYRYTRSVKVETIDQSSIVLLPGNAGQPYGSIVGYTILRDADGNLIVNPGGSPINAFPETSANVGKTTTLYLQFPLITGKSFLKNKLLVRAGLTADFLLQATEIKRNYSLQNGFYEYKDHQADGISNLTLNGVFQTSYFITKHISVDLTYQRSFTSIYSDSNVGKAYYNIFSAGASFCFFKQQN